jgi:hypothetical protein
MYKINFSNKTMQIILNKFHFLAYQKDPLYVFFILNFQIKVKNKINKTAIIGV